MGKMTTSVVFLTGDDEPESVWASGPGAETAEGEPGVAGVINAPAATAVPAAAAAATRGKKDMHAFDIRVNIVIKLRWNPCPAFYS